MAMEVDDVERVAGPSSERRYYFDLLRMILIFLVFLVHSSLPFVSETKWYIQNDETTFLATGIIGFLYQWGMQLLFLVCGASAGFSLQRRAPGQFVKERLLRLGVPYVAGIVLLGPFQIYFDRVQHGEYQGSLAGFYVWFFQNVEIDWRLHLSMGPGHLWFLRTLLNYCVLVLPLYYFLKSDAGRRWLEKAPAALQTGGMLLWLIVPVAVVEMALRASYPEHGDWCTYVCWFVFFVYGYVMTTDRRYEAVVQRRQGVALMLGLASMGIMGFLFYRGYVMAWELAPTYTAGYLGYVLLSTFNTCCWVLFFLGASIKFLDIKGRWLRPASELVLPFYVLHQPIVVAVAFYVVQLQAGIGAKYLLIVVPSFLIIVFLARFVIAPSNVLRALFGMGVKRKEPAARPLPASIPVPTE